MLGRLWNFIKRHRRKFFVLGAVAGDAVHDLSRPGQFVLDNSSEQSVLGQFVGQFVLKFMLGSVLFYKWLIKRVKEIHEQEAKDALSHNRRQHHFESNQKTCNITVFSMLSSARESLHRSLNTEDIAATLKTNPLNKLELWDDMKILSFTRAIVAVYDCSIMVLLLRVQMNVIGGYMFLDNLLNRNGATKDMAYATTAIQERYLSLIKTFIEKGMVDLSHVIEAAVKKEIGSISLKARLTLRDVHEIISRVRQHVELGNSNPSQYHLTSSLCPFMLPPERIPDIEDEWNREDQIYDTLVSQTRDVIESDDFHNVLAVCLDRGFTHVMDHIADHYKQHLKTHVSSDDTRLHDVTFPMARLIPLVSSLMYKLCSDVPNPFIQELLMMDMMKNLSANVYEAFSQTPAGRNV